ncbi:hypothetical protein Q9291_04705 [Methylophilus aquaticus]|uniref:Uncharacterized protein n=2 Tax=Methylophilus aquaticus TaxID=1971610 RepID=A0ABT9JRF5_9PROT|nr:hypothetical protein [Methylophilus aquaticus]
MKTTFEYCLKEGLLGVGWRTASNQSTKSWDEYYQEASLKYNNLEVCKYLQKQVSQNDLVWTRDTYGNYYLARVLSGWEYWTTEESQSLDVDISNIFRVEIKQVDLTEVPGKITACFRASRTIQKIADEKASAYSRHLWNTLSGQQVYQLNRSTFSDIFMMLDDEETEDLVFLYLQSNGWYVIPNSRKADTMSFEYVCVSPLSGAMAITQVKTGKTPINRDDYLKFNHQVFLFQANEIYQGGGAPHIEHITRQALLDFLMQSAAWLPKSIKRKMEITDHRT